MDTAEVALVRRLYPSLRRFAAVVGPAEVEPDDLVQDALVKTLRRHRLTELEFPASYLWRTMRNLATDHRRRLGRSRSALARLGPAAPYRESYPSDLDDLESLPPAERAVLYLRVVEDLPYREIASILGSREASLRRTVTRARRRLRTVLAEEETDATT
jgi:RNA polymerase sigma-70 factor (ECF subfamily)